LGSGADSIALFTADFIIWIGVIPIGSLLVHFSLIQTRKWEILDGKLVLYVIYGATGFMIVFGLVTLQDMRFFKGDILVAPGVFMAIMIAMSVVIFAAGIHKTRAKIEKGQGIFMLVGTVLFGSILLNDIFSDAVSAGELRESIAASVILLILLGLPLLRDLRYIVGVQKEKMSTKKQRYKLKSGKIYLAMEKDGKKKARKLFRDQVVKDRYGLCFTWELPETLYEDLDLTATPIVRFSEVPEVEDLSPRSKEDLEMIPLMIEDIAVEGERAVALIEGLEKIVEASDMVAARRMFTGLQMVSERRKVPIIISGDGDKLGKKKMKFFIKKSRTI
jgi:hypothetical protein